MREGSTLSDEEEHQLIYEVVGKRAKRRTMHLLEQMDRTEQQLREKLKQGGYPQACIDLALEYVKSFIMSMITAMHVPISIIVRIV